MTSLQFNAVLLDISNELTDDQLDELKFLCQDIIGKRELEKIDTGRKLFQLLTQRGRLGADTTEYLGQLLTQIKRDDLSKKLQDFDDQPGLTDNQPDKKEAAKLDVATEVIAENLGNSWRKLGRKLGLTDVKLESISKRHPTDLEETVIELLKEWRKKRGAEARAEELIKALRDCQFILTAEKVEKRLATLGD